MRDAGGICAKLVVAGSAFDRIFECADSAGG